MHSVAVRVKRRSCWTSVDPEEVTCFWWARSDKRPRWNIHEGRVAGFDVLDVHPIAHLPTVYLNLEGFHDGGSETLIPQDPPGARTVIIKGQEHVRLNRNMEILTLQTRTDRKP